MHCGGKEKKENYKAPPQGKCRSYTVRTRAHTRAHTRRVLRAFSCCRAIPRRLLLCFHCSIFHLSSPARHRKDAACPNTTVSLRLKKLTWSDGGPLLAASTKTCSSSKNKKKKKKPVSDSEVSGSRFGYILSQ